MQGNGGMTMWRARKGTVARRLRAIRKRKDRPEPNDVKFLLGLLDDVFARLHQVRGRVRFRREIETAFIEVTDAARKLATVASRALNRLPKNDPAKERMRKEWEDR